MRFELNREHCHAVISISFCPWIRGKGFSREIMLDSIRTLICQEPDIQCIHALIKQDNPRSLRVFEKAGFHFQDEQSIQGCKSELWIKEL